MPLGSKFENLVFSGGGIKGVAYAGIPTVLKNYKILNNIKKVAGTSAGSIAALLIALKYKPKQIEKIISKLDFNNFIDTNLITKHIFKLFFYTGIQSGARLEKWIKAKIKYKTGSESTTFAELFELTKIELVITAVDFDSQTVSYFSHKTSPDMPIWIAVRASTALPVYYEMVYYNGRRYMDGGPLANYPIWVFDNPDSYEYNSELMCMANESTIGFRLITRNCETSDNNLSRFMPNIFKVVIGLIDIMVNYIDDGYDVFDYTNRSVMIHINGVKATDFSLSNDQLDLLKQTGIDATIKFLDEKKIQFEELEKTLSNRNIISDKLDRYGLKE